MREPEAYFRPVIAGCELATEEHYGEGECGEEEDVEEIFQPVG